MAGVIGNLSLLIMLATAVAFLGLYASSVDAGLTASRTVNALNHASAKLTIDQGCASSDQYGSNDCSFRWGDSFNVDYAVVLQEDITGGSIEIDAKVNKYIPFQASCAPCGAPCDITVPIIQQNVTIDFPPCPITATELADSIPAVLPASNPLGVKLHVAGSVKAVDQNGDTVADIDLDVMLTNDKAETQPRTTPMYIKLY